jgi:hypothetical protein
MITAAPKLRQSPILTPLSGVGLVVARLVGAGRDCGEETSADCVIVVAAFESPAVIAGLDDVTVMGQAIEQRVRVATQSSPQATREVLPCWPSRSFTYICCASRCSQALPRSAVIGHFCLQRMETFGRYTLDLNARLVEIRT